ncbi:hypothetical protein D3C87_2026760 [compost metagenome]
MERSVSRGRNLDDLRNTALSTLSSRVTDLDGVDWLQNLPQEFPVGNDELG